MEEEKNEVWKNALSIFKISVFVTVCMVTVFNSYRMILLQTEIQEVKEKWEKSDSFRTMTEVKRLTDILEKGFPEEILERLGRMEENLKRAELVELKRNMDRLHQMVPRLRRSVEDSSRESELNDRRRTNFFHSKHYGNQDYLASESPIIESGSTINTISRGNRSPKKSQARVRASKVMNFDTEDVHAQQVVKQSALKSLDTGSYGYREYNYRNSEPEFTTVRNNNFPNHAKHLTTGRIKPLPSIHLSGDTSRYHIGIHQNYEGNGHLQNEHPQNRFMDWKPKNWVEQSRMMNHFEFNEGYLTIKEAGLYFIYAQIFYYDKYDSNGFKVFKNDEAILQCTVELRSNTTHKKGNTCYTAAVEYIARGDRISLVDVLKNRYSILQPGMSFFGAIKLGDVSDSM